MKGRVLVIDDEPAVGRTILRLLGDAHDVRLLTSGHDAIALLTGGEEFDVVFCDLSMPEISGIEVYQAVAAARPDLAYRFVFISGGAYTSRFAEFLDAIPNTRLDKPFDVEAVRALVRSRIGVGAELETTG